MVCLNGVLISIAVGPLSQHTAHPINSRCIFRRHLLGSAIQEAGMASVCRFRLWSWARMGGV